MFGQVTRACRQAGFVPRAVQKDVWLMQTIVGLVAGDMGVALVPASLRNLRRRGVIYKPVDGLSPTVEMGWYGVATTQALSCARSFGWLGTAFRVNIRSAKIGSGNGR